MVITLTTDFGNTDSYVASMKGVILSIAPDAQIIDITHEVSSYNVLEGAFILSSVARSFPDGTVHLGVVDPGVGSKRRPIGGFDGRCFFVGPDNGLLSLCLSENEEIYHITNEDYFLCPTSRTFHGRDIFAPVAAQLAIGVSLHSVGPRILDFCNLVSSLVRPCVLHVDRFGNIITSLRPEDLSPTSVVRIGSCEIQRTYLSFSEAPSGELFLIQGSSGYMEISMNQDSAADRLNVQVGMELELESNNRNQ